MSRLLRQLLTPINADGTVSAGDGCKTAGELWKLRMAMAYSPSGAPSPVVATA